VAEKAFFFFLGTVKKKEKKKNGRRRKRQEFRPTNHRRDQGGEEVPQGQPRERGKGGGKKVLPLLKRKNRCISRGGKDGPDLLLSLPSLTLLRCRGEKKKGEHRKEKEETSLPLPSGPSGRKRRERGKGHDGTS